MKPNLRTARLSTCIAALALTACGKDDDSSGTSANLPMLTPPVREAAPAGLTSQTGLNLALSTADFSQRFFAAAGGPTNIFRILTEIDTRLANINSMTASTSSACQTQDPVAYTIHPAGQNVTFYAQCKQTLAAGPVSTTAGLIQFGVKDGITYLYTAIGAGQVAAIATPVAGTSNYTVKAWASVGEGNAPTWDSGSYALMELTADAAHSAFEFGVAGIGVGYCGAQLKSDGTSIYAIGSVDMGTTCVASDTLCVAAASGTGAGTCTGALQTFTLPAIGRRVSTGANTSAASLYPTTPNLTFDGTAADAIHFGPTTATAGVTEL